MRKVAYDPKGNKIEFEAKWHSYYVNGKKYTSATTLLKDFFPKFDREGISERYAKKHGMTQEAVLEMWEKKGEKSRNFGNLVHEYVDRKLKSKPTMVPIDEKQKAYFKSVDECLDKLFQRYELIESEKIIFSVTHQISGTVDLVFRDKSNGDIVILDWKTGEKLETYNSWGETGLNGLEHLDHCNYMHYALQLNLYRYILEVEKYFDAPRIGMGILHVADPTTKPYKIENMQPEIETIIRKRSEI